MHGQRIIRLALSALILAALLLDASGYYQYPFLNQLENWTYDVRLNATRPDTHDDRIVIVDIDENSLEEVGRWPWGRDKLATIVDNLFNRYQASVVGFDIVFAEKDKSSGLEVFEDLAENELRTNTEYLNTLNKIRPTLELDRIFAKSLENKNVIMGYYFKATVPDDEVGTTGSLPPSVMKFEKLWSERLPINEAKGYGGNLQILQRAAAGGGFFDNPHVDQDGVFRRVPLLQSYEDHLYPSLALAITQAYLNVPRI
ncbi:MAG: CHASE2 domain-containing protein, partial [Gammaproteobacteria bacterium]|nr:CHASE2 domain-containing protein [Gammaproteobacteria bacterium]